MQPGRSPGQLGSQGRAPGAGAESWQHSPHQGVVEGVDADPALCLSQLLGSPVGIIPHLGGGKGASAGLHRALTTLGRVPRGTPEQRPRVTLP